MSLVTLGLSTILSAVMDLRLFRGQIIRDLEVLAAVVGENCVSSLVFDSPETATRHLSSLRGEYQIRSAVLLDNEGGTFADWARPRGEDPSEGRGPLNGWLAADVEVSHAIQYDGRLIGRLILRGRLDELRQQFLSYLGIGALAALVTLGIAWALALGLQRRIGGPILALARRSRAISQERDFSVRLPDPRAGDEITMLVQGFNAVLQGLAERESELARQARALDQANAKLRDLAVDLAMLEDKEKSRLATELHDGPLQQLALAQIHIEVATQRKQEESSDRLQLGIELLSGAIRELRSLQFDLSPPVLETGGLPAALSWLAESTQRRWGLTMTFRQDGPLPALDRPRKVLLFQCARELVMNVVKHAHARGGRIELTRRDGCLELLVEDDGVGFGASPGPRDACTSGGYGSRGVCERLALVDGGLTLENLKPGARVRLWIPIGPETR
jgi:signal transduction histidine kinase